MKKELKGTYGKVVFKDKVRDVLHKIIDNGIGISKELQKHIFERFYQVDGSTRRRFGGMGIGLALVWEIVEAHGGNVRVESVPGEGSTFTIVLPILSET